MHKDFSSVLIFIIFEVYSLNKIDRKQYQTIMHNLGSFSECILHREYVSCNT